MGKTGVGLTLTDYQSEDCNEGACSSSKTPNKWKMAGQLQSEENLSDRYSKSKRTE